MFVFSGHEGLELDHVGVEEGAEEQERLREQSEEGLGSKVEENLRTQIDSRKSVKGTQDFDGRESGSVLLKLN